MRNGVFLAPLLLIAAGCSGEMQGAGASGSGGSAALPEGAAGTPPVVDTPPVGMGTPRPPDVVEPTDWFSAVQSADCNVPAALSRTRIRRLGTAQWSNTVQAALGGVPDVSSFPVDAINADTGFDTDAVGNKVNVLLANAYFDAAQALAPTAATGALAAHACLATQAADPACGSAFVNDYGRRLFRRPLSPDETTRYSTLLATEAALDPADVAVGTVIRAMLLSPNMIYLTELGTSAAGEVALTPYEQAALISYLVADSPPDQMLSLAAEQGLLGTAAERSAQAQRLLQTPAARAKYADFWHQYLPAGDLRKATDVDPALVTAMEAERQQHFDEIVWEQGGSFADLLTAPVSYGSQELSEVYGTMTPDGSGGYTLPVGERAGFATQGGFLFSPDDSSVPHKVIGRGLAVRLRLLCQPPTPPPPTLMPDPAALVPLGPDATPYESYEAFTAANPACAGCHQGFQPLGLAFESYDDLGRHRTSYENGDAIVTNGDLGNAGDASGPYSNAVELIGRIGNSQVGEYCFTRQYAEYALGRRLHASLDACTIRALGDSDPNSAVSQFATILSGVETGSNRFHTPVTQ